MSWKSLRLDKLEAENKQLRKELKQLQNGYGSMSREHSQTIVELSNAYFEIDQLKAENTKLREFASESFSMAFNFYHGAGTAEDLRQLEIEYRELRIEVDE